MTNYIPLFVAFFLMFLNVPVALSLIAGTFVYFTFITDTMPLTMIAQKMVSANMSSTLLAVPFFMMIGVIMNHAGITKRLMGFCDALVGHKVGGLAHVNVLLSTINGGICGSGAADAAMQCKILVPEMTKRGYPLAFSAAVTAASGLIAPIIPPGAGLILYGVMTETSVGKMFVAGYLPGLLMCVVEMLTVVVIAHRRHFQPSRSKRAPFTVVLRTFVESVWSILIALVLIVGLRLGLFTITEGTVVVIILCLIVGFVFYKELRWKHIAPIFRESFHSTCSIMLMILSAIVFGMYLSWAHIPQEIAAWTLALTDDKHVFLLLAMVLLLVFGMFLDGTAMLMIMTPLLFPVAKAFDVDPVHFGILMIVNASIGSLTPPLGGLMYVCCNLCKVSIAEFVREALPFIVALFVLLLAMLFIPSLTTFVPDLIYR